MSDRESTVTYRDRKRAGAKRSGLIRGTKSLIAAAIVAGLVITGATPAMANIGGGAVGGGGGNSGPASYFSLYTGDSLDAAGNPLRWGQASIDAFASAMEANAQWATAMQGRTGINNACTAAINQAIARSNGASGRARVVQVGVSVDTQNGNWYMGWGGTQTDMRNWYTQQSNANYWQPMLPAYPASLLENIYTTFYNEIGQTPRLVCVALNDSEVANYTLELSTDKNAVFSMAGSTAAVSDRINTSRAGSTISENVTANISLTWGGLEGNPRTVAKSVTVPNYGVTNSPSFTPAEFGWTSWPAGKFWFNVAVPKQGRMKAAVSHDGVNDPRENWTAGMTAPRKILTSGTSADPMAADEVLASGQFYNAQITARTNGFSSSMTISDTITTDKVWIGSQTGDVSSAAYVLDPNGTKVSGATIRVDRSGSAVTVTGTVANIPNAFQAQEYTLVVPTYMRPTEADYTIRDTSRVCYTAALTSCLDGNAAQTRKVTPGPDKSWVLDPNGALTNAPVDGKVFAPNSAIGAVVNGSIPANLAENLSQYSITDDWTGAARYIDFSDASKVRVYLDGVNVTSQFDIRVSGTKTIATAKAAFLNKTKGLDAAKPVKLYIGGTFRSDYDTDGKNQQLTNTGSETWNNETTEANTPAIFTATPDPDKHWVLNQNGALTSDYVDGKAFAPNSSISAVVNGSIPANLGSALKSYSITDDWAGAARYIDFSDASKVRVFLGSTNVTNQFDITVSGSKTVATAKAAFLASTKGRAAETSVKLVISGTFRSDYDTAGVPRSLTNSGSESWNGKTDTTNTPAIFTVTPDPDKHWVLDQNGALTNDAVDGKAFAPNSKISAVVNGSIPANLGSALTSYSITDDWSAAARYIDFSDASKVRVFLDGTNVTGQFTITVSGNKTVATAKPAFLASTKGRGAESTVKLLISGAFRSDYDTAGIPRSLTNTGSESWNGKTDTTNTPAIFTVTPDPDKHWVLDQNGALTNDDVDGKAFAPNSRISAVVNGMVPANLGSAMTSYSITDDWSAAARYIDFSDASKAKVFLNGTDVTNQFTIAVTGNKTVATAKASFLAATKGRAADAVVKLFIAGKFRSDYDTAGVPRSLTNAGSESWNGKVVTTNTPAIYTVTPDPNKVWVLDEDGALSSSDKDKANNDGVDGKTFAPGAGISAVVNGSLPVNLAEKMLSYSIIDDWSASAKYVDFSDASQAKVFLDGRNVTGEFTVTVSGGRTIATAKQAFLDRTIDRKTIGEVKLFITGSFRNDYDTDGDLERVVNTGSEIWNGKDVGTNSPAIYAVTPTPDKVWVLDEDGALSTSDEDWANNVGADGKVFLGNDAISAVVNGSIPADLASPLYHYSIVDDWTKAAKYVDFSDATKAKVFYNGKDVTSGFDVNVEGTKTIAVAKAPFLAATKGLAKDGVVKLVISGQFRDDFDTNGELISLTNSGSETWNNRTDATNSPAVFAWSPNPNKQVLGSAEESGDKAHDNINGASVWPGQKLEYRVGVDLRVPAGTARGVKTLEVEDVYDPYFLVDKTSVEFWDSRDPMGPKPVPRSAYELRFNEATHTFTAKFTEQWIKQNVSGEGANDRWLSQGWLTMRVTGTVSKSIPAGNTVVNQAFQIINGNRTATEIPTIEIPTVTPDKDSLSTDEVDIDGKTLVQGDVVLYRLTLDAGPARDKLAYNVHKLGIVDDFDEEFLDLEESDITVTEKATGKDVTGKFNVQIKDGVAYVFAKTVDTEGVYGGIIPGDPQPKNLAEFDAAAIRPLEDPIIDQALLGQLYNVNLRATVSKEQDGHVIENQARQNIQNVQTTTRIVSNPIKDIDPTKDAVISEETKDESIEGTEVRMNTVFNYRLNSSEIPADRAYAAKSWKISDTFDRVHDQYTGVWAIYANIDVYNGDEHLFKKGALLQDSAGHESVPWADLFDVKFDEDTYTFTATATKKYLDLVGSRPDLANAFSVYTKMVRVAPGEDIVNQATETYNGIDRVTNVVDTYTIEYPSVALEKFTHDEGREDGVHRNAEGAYVLNDEQLADVELEEDSTTGLAGVAVQKGVDVSIRFENTGDVPLKEVTLTDVTHDGLYGDLEGLVCLAPADPEAPAAIIGNTPVTPDDNGMVWVLPTSITELTVGEVVDCRGTLRGMKPGMTHADTAVVTGKSIFTDTVVKAHDTWYAKALSTPGIEIVEYTFDEGREKGDRNKAADAFVLTPAQAANGVFVGFDVTNTGDEPLSALDVIAETNDGFEGSVKGITWYDLVEETLPDTDPKPEEGAGETAPELEAFSEDEAPADDEAPSEEQPAEWETPVEEPAPETVELNGKQYVQRSLEELTDLEVGASALLLGTLVDVKEDSAHRNEVTITASGTYSGTAVSDDDPWNARFPLQPQPQPALPPNAGAVTGEGVNAEDARANLLGAAALMTIAAALVAEIMRRRQKARQAR